MVDAIALIVFIVLMAGILNHLVMNGHNITGNFNWFHGFTTNNIPIEYEDADDPISYKEMIERQIEADPDSPWLKKELERVTNKAKE